MKTSIIIPVYNNYFYTKLAIDSIRRNTNNYELIIVDNGSTDETPILGVEKDLIYVKNSENLGFGKACNIGAGKASGDYLLFLNNDVIVTPLWLLNMLKYYRYFRNLGVLGCKTNSISGWQKESEDYIYDLKNPMADIFLDYKAELVAKENLNKLRIFPRITGFCLMISRNLFIELGGFDERYGIGNFEDDDLCVKALNAGYTNGIAEDVWIYHFGSKTFELIDKDLELRNNLCRENERKFLDKFGFENGRWWEKYL